MRQGHGKEHVVEQSGSRTVVTDVEEQGDREQVQRGSRSWTGQSLGVRVAFDSVSRKFAKTGVGTKTYAILSLFGVRAVSSSSSDKRRFFFGDTCNEV
jgi:hypothetical protein